MRIDCLLQVYAVQDKFTTVTAQFMLQPQQHLALNMFVFLLGYLKFSDELEGLLVQWELGSMGFSAYRLNFCSRSLTIEVLWDCVQMC